MSGGVRFGPNKRQLSENEYSKDRRTVVDPNAAVDKLAYQSVEMLDHDICQKINAEY